MHSYLNSLFVNFIYLIYYVTIVNFQKFTITEFFVQPVYLIAVRLYSLLIKNLYPLNF